MCWFFSFEMQGFNICFKYQSVYHLPNIVTLIKSIRLRCTVDVARIIEVKRTFTIFTENPTAKMPLESHRRRWEDTITILNRYQYKKLD